MQKQKRQTRREEAEFMKIKNDGNQHHQFTSFTMFIFKDASFTLFLLLTDMTYISDAVHSCCFPFLI